MPERSSRAGVWMEPAAATTTLAFTSTFLWTEEVEEEKDTQF